MPELVRERTSQAVAERLIDLIFEGRLRPGDRLDIEALAAELGVSRLPVREALILLEQDGLIRLPHYRGAFVTDLDLQSVQEAFEMYASLCATTSARVAAAADPAVLADLDDSWQRLQGCADVVEFERVAREFRRIINIAASGPHLRALLRSFGGLVPAASRFSISRQMETEREGVRGELEALRSGDPLAAAGAAVAHVGNTARAAVAELHRRGIVVAAPSLSGRSIPDVVWTAMSDFWETHS